MAKRLFVGNLSFDTTQDSLHAYFAADGRKVASCQLMADRDTGRSRGFAFVDMASDADAASAIKALDGQQFEGRSLKVNEAQERKPRSFGEGRR